MALVGKKPYPKATVKKIIKAHSDLNIKKNADVAVCRDASYQKQQTSAHRDTQVYLNYVLFMETFVSIVILFYFS